MICEPSHDHGATVTCYMAHRCRCADCRASVNEYNSIRTPYRSRTSGCDMCRRPVKHPRSTCPECVRACIELWREERQAA